ncbi:MAG: SPOR domain-containing protein [Chitinophagaceae bacterium]
MLATFVLATLLNVSAKADTVIVLQDPRIEILAQKQAQINKRSAMLTSSGMYKGFRLQVASTQNREEAFKLKTLLISRFPNHKSYILFQSPYFKVRIGNFLKREDAEKLRQQMQKQFPSGVYLVDDAIEYTPTEEEETTTN